MSVSPVSSGDRPRPRCWLYDCPPLPYRAAWRWQQQLVADRKADPDLPDALILTEHPPIYTLGQGADLSFLKFDPETAPHDVLRVERGGEVTYHGPGQIVGYPIANLKRHQPDLHWYLRQLEAMLLEVLAEFGIPGERVPGLTGVWADGRKLAAIGIKVSRWIAFHGFSLNANPDLAAFDRIVPCGIADRPTGSMAEFCPDISTAAVRPAIARAFAAAFDLDLVPAPLVDVQAWTGDREGQAERH